MRQAITAAPCPRSARPRRRDRLGSAPGREDVVNDEDALTGLHGVVMDLDRGGSILRGSTPRRFRVPGELALLADWNDSALKWYATGEAKMNPRASMPTTLSTLPRPKCTTIMSVIVEKAIGSGGKHRRDVLEHDARLGEVRHVAGSAP